MLSVLRDVSLELAPNEALAVMGPSGSGKSTLMHILGTLDKPTSGTVVLDGCNPFTLPERELAGFRNRHIGFIFQDHFLLPQCSVLENVLIPTLAAKEDRAAAEAFAPRIGPACRPGGSAGPSARGTVRRRTPARCHRSGADPTAKVGACRRTDR